MPPLSIYVHIPWCVQKCPYCDFNSHQIKHDFKTIHFSDHRKNHFEQQYNDALIQDLQFEIENAILLDPMFLKRPIQSIFFGGGTPSVFSGEAIAQIIDAIKQKLKCAPYIEITLEANPSSVEAGRFLDYRHAGVNRLSLGIQSFNAQQLSNLGRAHNVQQSHAAIHIAHEANFENGINLDLMFALPNQQIDDALLDIKTALAYKPQHISHYQLSIEAGTAFFYRPPALPAEDDIWKMQKKCQKLLRTHGYQQYEVSAYAQQNKQCRHNLNYWQYGDYLAIGAGAHQKLTFANQIIRHAKLRSPQKYMRHAGTALMLEQDFQVAKNELPFEFMLNALRLNQGVSYELFAERTKLPISYIAPIIEQLQKNKLLKKQKLAASKLGRRHLNSVIEYFL